MWSWSTCVSAFKVCKSRTYITSEFMCLREERERPILFIPDVNVFSTGDHHRAWGTFSACHKTQKQGLNKAVEPKFVIEIDRVEICQTIGC